MPSVLILQDTIPHYRASFFRHLRRKAEKRGVSVDIGVLPGYKDNEMERATLDYREPIRGVRGPNGLFIPLYSSNIKDYDLIILEQANRNLLLALYLRYFRRKMLGFWGHGLNRMSDPNSWRNRLKKRYLHLPEVWFAYTGGVKQWLVSEGIDAHKVFNVQNTVDEQAIKRYMSAIDRETRRDFKRELDIETNNVVAFVGSMHPDKCIPFLLSSLERIKDRVEDLAVIFIGEGELKEEISRWQENRTWAYYLGRQTGNIKYRALAVSKLILMPGRVGLVAAEAIHTATPLVTTDYENHSPEIEYITSGVNGVVTRKTVDDFTAEVVDLLTSEERLKKLREGCRELQSQLTMEHMVDRFMEGMEYALNHNQQ